MNEVHILICDDNPETTGSPGVILSDCTSAQWATVVLEPELMTIDNLDALGPPVMLAVAACFIITLIRKRLLNS